MFRILKICRDTEDPEMVYADGKAFETLSKTECLEMGNLDLSPVFVQACFLYRPGVPGKGELLRNIRVGEGGGGRQGKR